MRTLRAAVVFLVVAAQLAVAAPAGAIPIEDGAGLRGTVTLTWGNTTGAPITSWNGRAVLVFDPSATARNETFASLDTAGERYFTVYREQVQSVRVTELASDRVKTVLCPTDDPAVSVEATETRSVASILDGHVAFSISSPHVDLVAGTGDLIVTPYMQADSGSQSWWLRDRLVLPGRWTSTGTDPCPAEGGVPPAGPRDYPRIVAVHGGAAIPEPVSDWLGSFGTVKWRLRRDGAGVWHMLMNGARHETFAEGPFGPQDTQQIDFASTSDLTLVGSTKALGSFCYYPTAHLRRATSVRAALAIARKAGFPVTTYAGITRVRRPAGFILYRRDRLGEPGDMCQTRRAYQLFLTRRAS
jgi:hypothetical protein